MIPVNNSGKILAAVFSFVTICLFFSCKKTDTVNPVTEQPADFSKKVTASVNGFVTNEYNAPVAGANVQYGEIAATTNQYGYFEIKNATVTENAAVVTVKMNGYFNGIKTFLARAGKNNFCRIKLIPKVNSGNVDAASGGDVTLTNGLKISLPSAGVVDAATNATYTGTIHVSSCWIDPTASDIDKIMPGDLQGINTNGALRSLASFGMAAVELTGNSGQLLQIAEGKKATIAFPINAAMAAYAPATIPLWYFDETRGLWMEEGTATKSGDTYVGEVKHFSTWNCDIPYSSVPVSFTVKDSSNNPLSNVRVDIVSTTPNSSIRFYTYTDESGQVSGRVVPDNSYTINLVFYGCTGISTNSKTFSVDSKAVDLGDINITGTAYKLIKATGTVTDCNNIPVSNGRVMLKNGEVYSVCRCDSRGNFNYSSFMCNVSSTQVDFIPQDLSASLEGRAATFTLSEGLNNVGNLQACGLSTVEYFNFRVDDRTYVLAPYPGNATNGQATSGNAILSTGGTIYGTNTVATLYDSANGSYNNTNGYIIVLLFSHSQSIGSVGNNNYLYYLNLLTAPGNSVNADIALRPLVAQNFNNPGSVPITITEYGAIDEYVSGHFDTTLYPTEQPNGGGLTVTTDPRHVSVNFRVRRIR